MTMVMLCMMHKTAFRQKVGSFQYNALLAITGPIRGTSKEIEDSTESYDTFLSLIMANLQPPSSN